VSEHGAGITSLNSSVKGGFIDMNVSHNKPSKITETDYSKIDPVSVYRNKVSLKKEPYDVNKVKYLFNKTAPSSESFTSFIRKAETNANVESRYYKNFVRWMDSNMRRVLWNNKCATGMCRIPIETVNGVKMNNIFQIVDFDYMIVWEFAVYDKGKYTILGASTNVKGDEVSKEALKQIGEYKKARKLAAMKYYRKYLENEFFTNPLFEKYFINPNVYEIVDRESVDYANFNKRTIEELFHGMDPMKPHLRQGSLQAYNDYVSKMTTNNPVIEEEKKIESPEIPEKTTPEKTTPEKM